MTRVNIITPQFERSPGAPAPQTPPADQAAWDKLRTLTRDELKKLGCGNWDGRLMLFPGEWYESIPAGFAVTFISGEFEAFFPGETSDDIRFGCLAYGIVAVDGKVSEE